MFKTRYHILFIAIAILLTSCDPYRNLTKKGTPEEKYNAALKYYAKDDFFHAQQLFDELIVMYRGTDKLEQIYYLYAQTFYKQNDLVLASYHFKYFAQTFPKSQYAEEAFYLSAYCKYLDSAPSNLDQTSTKAAITDMQMFINMYPESKKLEEANKIMDELQAKLLEKDYQIAKLYVKTEDFKPAIYALNEHLKSYPSTPYKEDVCYMIIKSNYDYAKKSVSIKQKERFTNTISACNNYIDKYPEGKYKKQALKYLHLSQAKIEKIDKTNKKKNTILSW